VAVFDVITDRKLTEAALRESESSLKRSQEIAHVGHWTWDTRANTVKWSEEMHRIFGMDPQAFDGDLDEVVRRAIHPDDVTRVREMNDQASREGRAGETEYRVVWPDGSIRHVWAVPADRVTDEHGRILRLSGVVQDITERKRAEEEREKLEVQLAQAQKLESVGRLAGGVAHDFNNMLAVVIGRAELAKMRLGAEDPLRSDLEEILTAAGRSADLTRQLLAFARRQTVRPEVLDPNDAVAGMLQMLRRLIGEDIDLAWMPGHDVWPIRIDPSQLDQILANLAVNARDALSGAGSVILGTENVVVDDPKWPGQEDFVPGDYVLLTVADTGAGMDREVLEHIFEPFFTTKEVGKGTGLGLATVHGVVRQNHGFIGVCSEPGKGTTFRIYLPRCQAEAAGASVQAASSPLGGTETLLLVEDDEAILGVLTILLERAGYTVLAAQAPSQALRLAEGHSGEIHLLLTDVVMPEMNGRQLADRLRGLRPGMKCLYMSGYTTDAIAHRGVLDEGVQFLSKPIRRNDLLAALRRVLDGK
jgi:PAS domain S-box-containing protein